MPLFEFICNECGTSFEKLVRVSGSQADVLCPSCKSNKTQKLLSGFAVASSGGAGASVAASAANCAPGGT
ncbi:MAG: zinc ribbon domain-containing protein [Caldilineaceae bacterium]